MKKLMIWSAMILAAGLTFNTIAQQAVHNDSSMAADEPVPEAVAEQILTRLRAASPRLNFAEPKHSPIEGYYEVSLGGAQSIYVSGDGKHFFSGQIYFVESDGFVNATERAMSGYRKEELAKANTDDMIIFSPKGETKAVISVFTDVTCGFCRRLHNEVEQLNDLGIEVRYLAWPRVGNIRQANGNFEPLYIENSKAWCAEDRRAAITQLKNGVQLPVDVCENNPIETQHRLGNDFGVSGTPAIILPSGALLPGYKSPLELAAILGIES